MLRAYTQFLDLYTSNVSVREHRFVFAEAKKGTEDGAETSEDPKKPDESAEEKKATEAAKQKKSTEVAKQKKSTEAAKKKDATTELAAMKEDEKKIEALRKENEELKAAAKKKEAEDNPPKTNEPPKLLPESQQINIDAMRSGFALGAAAPIASTALVAGAQTMSVPAYGALRGALVGTGALAVPAGLAYAGRRIAGAKGAVAGAGLGVGANYLLASQMGAAALPLGTSVAVPAVAGLATGVGLNYLGAGHNKIWGTQSKTLAGRMAKGLAAPASYPTGIYSRMNDYLHNREKTTGTDMLTTRVAPDLAKGASIGIAGGLATGAGLATMPLAIGAGLAARPAVGFGAKMHEKFWTDGQHIQNPAARIAMGLLSPLSVPYKALGAHYLVKKGPWAILKSIKSAWTGENTGNEGLGSLTGAIVSRPMALLKKGGRGLKWFFSKSDSAVNAAAQKAAELEAKAKEAQAPNEPPATMKMSDHRNTATVGAAAGAAAAHSSSSRAA